MSLGKWWKGRERERQRDIESCGLPKVFFSTYSVPLADGSTGWANGSVQTNKEIRHETDLITVTRSSRTGGSVAVVDAEECKYGSECGRAY
jgi:hypothetical protein